MVKCSLTLADLNEGQKATIKDIDVSSSVSQRLLELGFLPGTPVQAIKKAPMGDPITFEIRGYQLGLRKSESSLVKIESILPVE